MLQPSLDQPLVSIRKLIITTRVKRVRNISVKLTRLLKLLMTLPVFLLFSFIILLELHLDCYNRNRKHATEI